MLRLGQDLRFYGDPIDGKGFGGDYFRSQASPDTKYMG
jgi:hypothetical protein